MRSRLFGNNEQMIAAPLGVGRERPFPALAPEGKGTRPCEAEQMSAFRLDLERYLEACKNGQSCDMTNFREAGVVYFFPSQGSIKILPTRMGKPESCVS